LTLNNFFFDHQGLTQQQVEKMQTLINKTKTQSAKNDSNQAKLVDLQRIHDLSKARQKAEEERWEARISQLQNERDKYEANYTKSKASLASTENKVVALQSKETNLRKQLSLEEKRRVLAEEGLNAASSKTKAQESLLRQSYQEQEDSAADAKVLKEMVEEGMDALQEQQQQRRALEHIARQNAMQVNQLREHLQESSTSHSMVQMENRHLAYKVDAAESQVDYLNDVIVDLEQALQAERKVCQEAWLQVDVALTKRDIDEADGTLEVAINDEQSAKERATMQESSELLQMISEMKLQDEQERNKMLEDSLEELQDQYLGVLKENETLQETQRALEKSRQELESVEEAYDKGLLEVMRANKKEEEVKRELSQSRATNEALTSKVQQLEKLHKKLFHAKMKEEAWLQEREELLQELEKSSHYEKEYKTLRSQAQLLISKSNSYELQMEELSSLNTVLASHTNPSQKIFYLDRIRKELDEKRSECQVLVVERDELQSKCKSLQARLDLYCKVESRLEDRPRTAFKRVLRQSYRELPPQQQQQQQQVVTPIDTRGVLLERSPNRSPRAKVQQQKSEGMNESRSASVPRFNTGLGWAKGGSRFGNEEGDMSLDDLMIGA